MQKKDPFNELVKLMRQLRAPGGCPWDRQQTHASLRPFLLEETHEVLEAIESRDPKNLKDELGDLLFQVIFHAQLAAEARRFDIYDVIRGSLDKMTRRHPHVFGKQRARTAKQVLENWEEIKRRERQGSTKSLLAGVPRTLPALLRAHRVQSKAARVGFTWARMDEAAAKVSEEIAELENALLTRRKSRITEELGDAFFALVNLARFAGTNPEDALHQAIGKFIGRFSRLELRIQRGKKALSDFSQDELLELWKHAKGRASRDAKSCVSTAVSRGKPGKSPVPRKKRVARKNPGRPKPDSRGRSS